MRTKILTLAAAVAVLAPTLLVAGPGRGHGHHGMREGHAHHGMFHRALRQLDLSEEQRQQIHEVMSSQREEGAAAREQLREARTALAEKIHAEALDEAGVRTAARAVAALEEEQSVARARAFQQIREVLTPEQLERWEALKQEHRDHRQDRRERRQDRRERHGGPAGGSIEG